MKRGSESLSVGAEVLALEEESSDTPPVFDLLIVGSGYGGAVVAAHAANHFKKREKDDDKDTRPRIAVLERGLEYQSGDFPGALDTLTGHVRFSGTGQAGVRGWRDGLFDMRVGEDVSALVANGLGGGSLINAGVAEPADAATLADAAWPAPWRGDTALWQSLYARAEAGLGVCTWPPETTPKGEAMQALAERMNATSRPVRLTIDPPHGGCVQCGDCFTGCNANAKRTLCTTYLSRARQGHVHIYTGATVLRVERADDGDPAAAWVVRWVFSDHKRLPGRTEAFRVRARRVVLAAGTFGSTEILARSQCTRLRLSSLVGHGFSTNGDVIGAQYGVAQQVNTWARDGQKLDERHVGPTITHQIELDRDNRKDPTQRLVVQNLTVPAALGWIFGEIITGLALPHRWTRFDLRRRTPRSDDLANVDDTQGGALDHTLLLTAFGHDGAAGRLVMLPGFDDSKHDGHAVVHWPRAGSGAFFLQTDRRLKAAAQTGKCTWLRNPLWQATPDSPLIPPPTNRRLVTVHPLGGCRMARNMMEGVVDPYGRVFDGGSVDGDAPPGQSGSAWAYRENQRLHDGLFVLDGSIVPTSLGINPLLTITALAEGIAARWMLDWGWTFAPHVVPTTPPVPVPVAGAAARPVLGPAPFKVAASGPPPHAPTVARFTERMSGLLVSPVGTDSPDVHQRVNMVFGFAQINDVGDFLRQKRKALKIDGQMSLVSSSWDPVKQRQTDKDEDGPVAFSGEVRWFEQERCNVFTRVWRTLRAWRQLRADADLAQPSPGIAEIGLVAWLGGWVRRIWAFAKVLTHFGAPRLLAYKLEALADLKVGEIPVIAAGDSLSGAKSLVYVRDGNPWNQLTTLDLYLHPKGGATSLFTTLRYDELFMLGRDTLPLSVLSQQNGTSGLRDSLAILMYVGRVLFLQHYLSFRKPDYAAWRPLRRLPFVDPKYDGMRFDVFEDVWSKPQDPKHGIPVRLRLTRIRRARATGQNCDPPVLLLHGFGSGGIQFTHPAIPTPMAHWLAAQGRDVWVGELRTSIGLPSCRRQWVMDDIAREDIPGLVDAVRRLRHELDAQRADQQVDIVAHCIGSAMFCMATLAGELQGKIGRAVLMQVGPIVHLPRASRVRGYIGNRLQKLLGMGMIEATVDDTATDADVMLDRVLATYPYEKRVKTWEPREMETGTRIGGDLAQNGRIVNALRSAGVFAQLFQWPNLSEGEAGTALLDAMPDLLGPCNLTTYQQTVQYAFLRRLTNQDGEAAYVTDQKVEKHMGFPILFIQGSDNDVFAARGTHDCVRLLKRIFGDAHPVQRQVIEGYGHLDCVVGIHAGRDVFVHIQRFLSEDKPAAAPPAKQDVADFRAPCVGPWIGHVRECASDAVELRIGLKTDDQRTPPPAVYSVLAIDKVPLPHTLAVHLLDDAREASATVPGAHEGGVGERHPEGEAVILVKVPKASGATEVWVGTADGPVDRSSRENFVKEWKKCRDTRASRAPRSGIELPVDTVYLQPHWLAQKPVEYDLSFAVLACRQAPLLLDRNLADEACKRLAGEGLNHVLMVGDQIYADALAASSGVDGTRLRYFDAHREAWTAPHQQSLMQRLPVYMAADDHEYRDDAAAYVAAGTGWGAASTAMWRYQFAPGPRGMRDTPKDPRTSGEFWYEMTHMGSHTFVCDTRYQRQTDTKVDGRRRAIMGKHQFSKIEEWLEVSRDSKLPRFLVLPSPAFPHFRDAVRRPEYRLRCDNWQRFPASMERLLGMLLADGLAAAEVGAGELVLLSGDYHCFVVCGVTIRNVDTGRSIHLRSVTTSGVYCPYTTVNTDREELWESAGDAEPVQRFGAYELSYSIDRFEAGPGYTVVRAKANATADISFERL